MQFNKAMNKKIESQKIKVNNFSEMFAKMRKIKNSGGEWKLLERRSAWIPRDGIKTYSEKGFIISNGTKKVDISYELDTIDPDDFTTVLGPEDKKELRKIFSEESAPFLQRKTKYGQSWTVKNWAKDGKIKRTSRYLSAWSFNDIYKILVDYYQANKNEIDQSTEKNLPQLFENEFALSAPWLEVGDDDKLFYIWVGKRDTKKGYHRGDGELEISLKKSNLVEKYDENGIKLDDFSGSAQKLKARINAAWINITSNGAGNSFKNYQLGFDHDCYDKSGNPTFFSGGNNDKVNNRESEETNSTPEKFGQFQSFVSSDQQVEEQVRRYMEQNNIFRLTLDNDKLVIEYNKISKKEEKEINSENFKAIKNYLKEHNNSVKFDQLKTGSLMTTNPDKKLDYIFWIVGGVGILVVGVFVYWIIRKRKVKKFFGKRK